MPIVAAGTMVFFVFGAIASGITWMIFSVPSKKNDRRWVLLQLFPSFRPRKCREAMTWQQGSRRQGTPAKGRMLVVSISPYGPTGAGREGGGIADAVAGLMLTNLSAVLWCRCASPLHCACGSCATPPPPLPTPQTPLVSLVNTFQRSVLVV